MLEKLAEKNQILFQSTSNYHETLGKPLFKFGKSLIYIDDEIVFLATTNEPISLEKLQLINKLFLYYIITLTSTFKKEFDLLE
ncbi:hypothetical protein O9G_001300 [Rozella allomycis CSF55]|uniref:Uncharacterized protein n=1 Tax=Rozella allomycis (strain CSF55) TaxID=988480 RepID=A0A075AQA7_ROZAC|nr:hypothetical protein O9G_001300 [Rozella allomycis CSF55]|eukprot:EPZ32398.1 hypothetical protein O9G_001300 [Rozella allomycis CSF55]